MARELLRLIVYYRRWLTVAMVLIISYSVFNALQPGHEVLIATQQVVAGQPVTATSVIRVADLPNEWEVVNSAELSSLVANQDLAAGTILTASLLTNKHASDSVTVSIAVDAITQNAIATGSRIHIWALNDQTSSLVSSHARLLAIERSAMSTIATIAIPRADEYAVMQAAAIRIAKVDYLEP